MLTYTQEKQPVKAIQVTSFINNVLVLMKGTTLKDNFCVCSCHPIYSTFQFAKAKKASGGAIKSVREDFYDWAKLLLMALNEDDNYRCD